jgi:hypothetical protein
VLLVVAFPLTHGPQGVCGLLAVAFLTTQQIVLRAGHHGIPDRLQHGCADCARGRVPAAAARRVRLQPAHGLAGWPGR